MKDLFETYVKLKSILFVDRDVATEKNYVNNARPLISLDINRFIMEHI